MDKVKVSKIDVVMLEIQSCEKCPNLKTQRYYTSDSWDDCTEWLCKISTPKKEFYDGCPDGRVTVGGRRIAVLDWNDKDPKIPKWCPLRENKS